jgi:NADH-quinone oxidoreductase subunit C
MALSPAVTDLDQLKEKPEVAALLGWNADAVDAAKFDRNELTIWIKREFIVAAVKFLRDHPELKFNMLCDVTCVDWFPSEPRFEVRVASDDPRVSSVISIFPSCNFFEREVFDLFGITFEGHPYLKRIMMPDDWKGHPLRKDYPVEGYR